MTAGLQLYPAVKRRRPRREREAGTGPAIRSRRLGKSCNPPGAVGP